MSDTVPTRVTTLIFVLLALWTSASAAELATAYETAGIPAARYGEMKSATDKFMRQFSANEYKTAFGDLFSKWGAGVDKSKASTKASEMAVSMTVGEVMLKGELGPPIKGEFAFVGSRRIGHRLLKFAYFQKRTLAPLPVVLVFNKADMDWTISQVAIGADTAVDVNALWVHEPPNLLQQTIADFPKILTATDQCMKALVEGNARPPIEKLVKSFSHNAPKANDYIDSLVNGIEGRPDMGKSMGYELVGVARQSDCLCNLVYGWRFEKVHSPICFQFYKPAGHWLLWRVKLFDDATPDLTACTVSEPAKGN